MDFAWTEKQEALYQNILQQVATELRQKCSAPDRPWTREEWQICARIGLQGLSVPEAYGGAGCDALTTARAYEAFGKKCIDMGLVFSTAAHLFACTMPIAEYGSAEARERWLPGLCSGTLIGANAITEVEAGSDVFALKTRAVRDGDNYVLTGTKSFVSNGPCADIFMVYATTNPAHGYLGITGFVVEKCTSGLSVGEPFHKMGLTSTLASQIYLNECRIPIRNRIGEEGQGALIFKASMQWERSCLFAAYLGQMERQIEQSVEFARSRHQFRRAIGKNQAISHRIADMKLRLESARLLLYQACWLFDCKKPALLAIALAKLAVSESAVQGALDTLRIHGAAGYLQESGVEGMIRDALPGTIFSGTSEMQRDIIANELGL